MWIYVCPIEKWNLILKIVERDVFLMNRKHQYHLSQCVYGAQSWNEKRLLCESMLIRIGKWTLTLKMIEKDVFHKKPKHQFIYPTMTSEFVVHNHYKKGDYYVNVCLSQLKNEC